MKTLFKILAFLAATALLLKGCQIMVDHLYKLYGQKYVSTDIHLS